MTDREVRDEVVHRLITNPGHTIVKHVNSKGKECWRIRDKNISPIMNFSDKLFEFFHNHNMVKQITPRHWIFLKEKWDDWRRSVRQ